MKNGFLISLFFILFGSTIASANANTKYSFLNASWYSDYKLDFLALGDTGTASEQQYQVGDAMAHYCTGIDCQFALLLGDNFYQGGVSSVQDPLFQTMFEMPYKNVNMPFYVIMGNHDYGERANLFHQAQYQIDYSQYSEKWTMPAKYYYFVKNEVLFIAIDTMLISWNREYNEQVRMVREALAMNNYRWVVVLGHHPYLSNGPHGNAGRYDNVTFIPVLSGKYVKKFYEENICNKADLYLSGHDHSMQVLPGNTLCPRPLLVVSGGGAKLTKLGGKNPTYYEALDLGFAHIEFSPTIMKINIVNELAEIKYTHTYEKLYPIR